jgi:hypothetical protein
MHLVALCHILLHHLHAGLLLWVVSRLSSVVALIECKRWYSQSMSTYNMMGM